MSDPPPRAGRVAGLVKRRLGYPVIDTAVYDGEPAPELEEYVAAYGGPLLVDQLRAAARLRLRARGFQQSAAPALRPDVFCDQQERRGSDHSIVLLRSALPRLTLADPGQRQMLHRAINHHNAQLWSRVRRCATFVAGVPLHSARDGIVQLEFATKRLGYKVIAVDGAHLRNGDQAPASRTVLDEELDPFWARVQQLGVAVVVVAPSADPDSDGLAEALDQLGPVTRRFPGLGLCVLAGEARRVGAGPPLSVSAPGSTAALRLPPGALYSSSDRSRAGGGPDALLQTWRLVEQGLLAEHDFRAFVFETPHQLFTAANPAFFQGTDLQWKLPVPVGSLDAPTGAAAAA